MRWVFLATDNIASLTNAHHGRPVFFNLQTSSAAGVGCGEWFRVYALRRYRSM
jgi:hypothetical protein